MKMKLLNIQYTVRLLDIIFKHILRVNLKLN